MKTLIKEKEICLRQEMRRGLPVGCCMTSDSNIKMFNPAVQLFEPPEEKSLGKKSLEPENQDE